MANFFFDGTASVTAAKADNVLITANPALFTSQAQSGANVVFTYSNGTTLTVTGTTLGDSATNLPGIQLASGQFATGATANGTTASGSQLFFGGGATQGLSSSTFAASSVHTAFGGNGVSDSSDTADTFSVGGKGSFLIYGNAGADTVTQVAADSTTAFDSSSFVTIFGGKNDVNGLASDTITLNNTSNLNAKMAIYGGEGTDTISVTNTGANANTAIFGGQGAADSTDSADTITFNGGGTVNIFGNAGNDTISVGATGGIDSTGVVTVHGGLGADGITISAAGTATKINIVAFGDQNDSTTGADSITVNGNSGNTQIFGGTAAADSADGADVINYSGQGTANIFAAGGNDTVVVNTTGQTATSAGAAAAAPGTTVNPDGTSTTNVFLGNGNDSVFVLNSSTATGITTVVGGAGNDTFTIGATDNALTASAGTGLSVVISDFGTGFDLLQINNGGSNTGVTPTAATVPTGGFTSLQQALDAAANVGLTTAAGTAAAGTVGVATFNGDTYVVLNTTTGAGFSSTLDLAVKLTGVTSAASVAALTTVI